MQQISYTDKVGRMWLVNLPDGMPASDASLGIPVGPPSLEGLGFPEEIEVALHNQLFARKIFTWNDANRKRLEVVAAIQGALKLDADRIVSYLHNIENGNNTSIGVDSTPVNKGGKEK